MSPELLLTRVVVAKAAEATSIGLGLGRAVREGPTEVDTLCGSASLFFHLSTPFRRMGIELSARKPKLKM